VLARAAVRSLLWITVALPATWAALWVFERLLFTGVFSFEVEGSPWLYIAFTVVALAAGNAAAYACDRVFVRLRARSRTVGRAAGRAAES
jgi:hypothetical protein